MCHRYLLVIGMSFLFSSSVLAAEPPPNANDDKTEVIVTANRIPGTGTPIKEFPGHVTIISAQDIQQSGANDVAALLSRYPGVSTFDSRGFGLGADSAVNLRGVVNSSRSGALVLLDGVRQNSMTGDAIHWQSIPLSEIERIEIIRGGNGVIFGEGALSGVINIVTKKEPTDKWDAESGVEVGSYGQRKYTVSTRARHERFRIGTSYQRKDVGGYREASESRNTTVTAHTGIDITPEWSLNTQVLHSEDTTRFSGGLTPEASQARRRQAGSFPGYSTDELTTVTADMQFQPHETLDLALTGFIKDQETHSITAFGDFASFSPSRGLHLRATHTDDLTDDLNNQLVAGIDLADEKSSTGTVTGTYSESNKQSYGLFVEDTLRLFDRASFIAGARFDQARFQEDLTFPNFEGSLRFQGWSPRVGASFDVTDQLTVYANYARPFKSPNVFDFSAPISLAGFPFNGNIDLSPQQGQEFELGLHWEDELIGKLDATWFHSIVDDEILFNSLAFQNQNFDTRRIGVELSYEPKLPIEQLQARLAYTFLDAEFRKGAFKGNTLPAVPDHAFSLYTQYDPINNLELWMNWELIADFFRINDFANRLPGDNYGVLDVGIRYTYRWATTYITVENATDEEYTRFQSSNGTLISTGENPMPPRTYLAGVRVSF